MLPHPSEGPSPVRLFIVDDHELIRLGLRAIVDREEDLVVAGEAASAREALRRIAQAKPDVVLLDVRLPDGNGVDVCREIRSRFPGIKVLIVTSYEDQEALLDSIMAGAAGFVLKATVGTALVDAVRRVSEGQSLIDPAVTATVFSRLRRQGGPDPLSGLSTQERRILDLIAEGLTNREIATRLHLAEQTVKNYVSSTLTKLGLQHRTQAALFAVGLLEESTKVPGIADE